MLEVLYKASFFLYEISFVFFALALVFYGLILDKFTRAFHLPPVGWLSFLSALFLLFCAWIHFYVYHFLSPQYLISAARDQLILMYIYKTISMVCILLAGLALMLGNGLYLKKIT